MSKTKRFLHIFFKIFIIFMIGTLILNVVIFSVIYCNHKSKSKAEAVYMYEPGTMVYVNDHYVHVLEGGNTDSDKVLVFMHGDSVVDDSVALQPLFEELSDYHLVLVERSGYGYTGDTGASKDMDSILEEMRLALTGAGIDGPYILVPEAAAGVYAIYWADLYPEEVSAIVGISMYYPEQYADITSEEYVGFFDYLMAKFCSIGGYRLMSSIYPEDAYDIYTTMQMNTRNALLAQVGYTDDMFEEKEAMVDNANTVAELGFPTDTPILNILANPCLEPYLSTDSDTKESLETYQENYPDIDFAALYNADAMEYLSQYENVTVTEMAGIARLYTYDPATLAELMTNYIEETLQ